MKEMKELTVQDLRRALIPERYWEVSFREIPDEMPYKLRVKNYVGKLDDMIKDGVGLYLYSEENSTGKTSLATIIGKYALRMKKTVMFIQAWEYIDMVIGNMTFDEIESMEQRAHNVDILIIDDAVKEYRDSKGFTGTKIENLIRGRSQRKKVTIVTSNKHPKDIRQVYSIDLSELMKETMIPVEIKGMNWRALKEKELRNLI